MAFEVLDDCLAGRVRLLNRVITAIYDEKFRRIGIRNGQFTMLCVLARMGRIKPVEMQSIMQMDASTVSRNVQRMKGQGWVRIVPDDERSHFLEITPAGEEVITRCYPAWQEAQQEAFELLGRSAAGGVRTAADKTLDRILAQMGLERKS